MYKRKGTSGKNIEMKEQSKKISEKTMVVDHIE